MTDTNNPGILQKCAGTLQNLLLATELWVHVLLAQEMPLYLVLTPSIGFGPISISSTYTPGAKYSGI